MPLFNPRPAKQHYRLRNATRLHETNFLKLQRVIPSIRDISKQLSYHGKDNSTLSIDVVDRSKYTTTFLLELQQHNSQSWLSNLQMKVRIYHDANVAEVLSFQNRHRLDSRYEYPNPQMYHRNEKWQINDFLGDWLDHCLRNNFIFTEKILPIDV